MPTPWRGVAALTLLALVTACSTPSGRLRALAAEQGFERRSVRAEGFVLTLFENAALGAEEPARAAALPAAGAPSRPALHVYLEGDGTPWLHRIFVMSDPTPRRPLMLELMALDERPAVYVGRPCYNGRHGEPGCEHALWTSERYSTAVVASMTGAIERLMRARGAGAVRLLGHSGGGSA